jgi:proline iminopeptidase
MITKIIKYLFYAFLLASLILLFLILIPRQYDVPKMQFRENTKYWDLETGSRIAYTLVRGKEPRQQTPIIYLHGGPGGPIYNSNIKILSNFANDGYDVYLYDQIGCGHSARLKDISEYTANRHKEDLFEIVKSIGSEKVILIGQSWGAILANLFIADHPNLVAKVIFSSPGPIFPIRKGLEYLEGPDSLNLIEPFHTNHEGNLKAHNIRSMAMLKWAYLFGWKLASEDEADQFATFLNAELSKSTVKDTTIIIPMEGGAGFYSHVMTLRSLNNLKDIRPSLDGIEIPALILKGQYDNQKWGYTEEYLQLYLNHKLVVIPKAGHSIFTEQPLIYIKTIRDFINQ